jgi:hypothetical protein
MDSYQKTAASILKFVEESYLTQREYREVDIKLVKPLNHDFYEHATALFLDKGCVHLGDIEDGALLKGMTKLRTVIRVLASATRITSLGVYEIRLPFWTRVQLFLSGLVLRQRFKFGQTLDCETELSDGSFLITTTEDVLGRLDDPPGFVTRVFPAQKHWATVFESHQAWVNEYLTSHPDCQATQFFYLSDVLAMQHRMQERIAAFRKQVRGVTAEELKRFGVSKEISEKVRKELEK